MLLKWTKMVFVHSVVKKNSIPHSVPIYTKALLELSNKMDTCYLLVDVQEIRIQPYFCIKQGDYFFSLFLGHPVNYLFVLIFLRCPGMF